MSSSSARKVSLLRRTLVAGGAASLAWPRVHAAPPFPARAVRIVVPYSGGVGPDVVARALAERLSQHWGQPVIVENKPGASGIVAFGEVRRTPPDGHTLYLADTATLAVNPLLHARLPYDPVADLIPLTLLFRATFVLWTGGNSRFTSIAALLEAARREPDRVNYATLGNGHASHVAIESMARAAGIQMLHIPFKDAGSLMVSLAAGDIDLTAMSFNTLGGLAALGKVRPLAVAAARRSPDYPKVPTLSEAGGPAVDMHPWAALVAVAGTPEPLLAQLHADITQAMASPLVRGPATLAGFEITPSSPQELRARVAADIALYKPLVEEGRIARL